MPIWPRSALSRFDIMIATMMTAIPAMKMLNPSDVVRPSVPSS